MKTGMPVHYVPLSEVALADAGFVLALAAMIRRAATGGEALLLGLPEGETLAERIEAVLQALAEAGPTLPRAPGWAVRFASAEPSAEELAGARVTLHPATAFWRLDDARREALSEVVATGSGGLAAFARLAGEWLGRPVAIARPPVPAVRVGAS